VKALFSYIHKEMGDDVLKMFMHTWQAIIAVFFYTVPEIPPCTLPIPSLSSELGTVSSADDCSSSKVHTAILALFERRTSLASSFAERNS
jgi:hypothetical protein